MSHPGGRLSVTLPDGRTATFEEMQAYGQRLQQFVREQEALLPQVADARRHNQIVDYLRLLAEGYNTQLRLFKAAEARRQQQVLVSAIAFVGQRPRP